MVSSRPCELCPASSAQLPPCTLHFPKRRLHAVSRQAHFFCLLAPFVGVVAAESQGREAGFTVGYSGIEGEVAYGQKVPPLHDFWPANNEPSATAGRRLRYTEGKLSGTVKSGEAFAAAKGLSTNHFHSPKGALRWFSPPSHTFVRQEVEDGPVDTNQTHKVQHIRLLNREGFWLLMGSVIFLVAAAVVTVEVNETRMGKEANEREPLKNCGSAGNGTFGDSADGKPKKKPAAKAVSTFLQLAFCVAGLNVSMLLWGVAQEFVITNEYVDKHGISSHMPSALFLVFCNRLGSVLFSGLLCGLLSEPVGVDTFFAAGTPAITNLLASWCQYSSIEYISFPLQTTAKSAKLLPVLLINVLRGKKQTFLDFAEAVVITSAVVIFGLETDGQEADVNVQGKGVMLLCGMMFFDSVTPHMQDLLFQKRPQVLVIQATFSMSLFACVLSSVVLLSHGHFGECFVFMQSHPEAILHLLVLSLCSTLTQFLITYTIKHFGPVVFIIIVTTRQVISVCLSSVLFMHHVSLLACVAAVIVFGTVVVRALWKLPGAAEDAAAERSLSNMDQTDAIASLEFMVPRSFRGGLANDSRQFLVCALAMHLPLCFWAVAQEFMATHTFGGELFPSSLFIIALNRVTAVLFAVWVLRLRALPIVTSDMHLTALPGATNFIATAFQYQALYFLRFPEQTLMKSVKVIPVMLCGRLLANRKYHVLDYLEAGLITSLAGFFVWYFEQGKTTLQEDVGIMPGVLLMIGYLVIDSFSNNIEDLVYQRSRVDPGQMLLGSELCSCVVSCSLLLASGQLMPSLWFLCAHHTAAMHVGVLAFASTCGAYACTVTIRLFGPAVFTMLMMSRQILSLVISVLLFQHRVDWLSCMCLVVLAMLVLTSSFRRVGTSLAPTRTAGAVAKQDADGARTGDGTPAAK